VQREPLSRAASSFQNGAGKQIESGSVGPVSVPLFGLPGLTWMPSEAARAAYGPRAGLTHLGSGSYCWERRIGPTGREQATAHDFRTAPLPTS
jgi:hypothetical protein